MENCLFCFIMSSKCHRSEYPRIHLFYFIIQVVRVPEQLRCSVIIINIIMHVLVMEGTCKQANLDTIKKNTFFIDVTGNVVKN